MASIDERVDADIVDVSNSDPYSIKLPIPIPIINNKAFLFDLNHIRYLRENYGITGMLSGVLPVAPQQNQLLGIPLRLCLEEVLYLISENVCYVVDNSKRIYEFWSTHVQDQDKESLKDQFQESVQDQLLQKRKEYEEKMLSMGLPIRDSMKGQVIENENDTFFVGTQDKSISNEMKPDLITEYYGNKLAQSDLLIQFIKSNSKDGDIHKTWLNYQIYRFLKKSNNFFLLPGLRFGGKFIAYPGDPLRYHSHLIINTRDYYNDNIGLLEIVNGGRLATSVKKLWCICGTKRKGAANEYEFIEEVTSSQQKEDQVITFSVEWAGFG